MKLRSMFILITLCYCALSSQAEPVMPQLKLDGNLYELSESFPYAKIQTAKLLFIAEDGYPAGTNEMYLVFYDASGYPRIGSSVDGHHAKFFSEDISEDGIDELIMIYSTGGSQRAVLGFYVNEGKLLPIEGRIPSSNMGKAEIRDGCILIQNQKRINEREALITLEQYKMVGSAFVLTDERSNLVKE